MDAWDLLTPEWRRPIASNVISTLSAGVALVIVMGAALLVFDLPELVALGAGLFASSVTMLVMGYTLQEVGM